jgi:SAM-dependent methyltransferase
LKSLTFIPDKHDAQVQTELIYADPVNAVTYKKRTDDIDLAKTYAELLENAPTGKTLEVLDLGCGPGRDSAFFLSRGFSVTSVDASLAMIDLARHHNPDARVERIEEICYVDEFDVVWASASLLHLPRYCLFSVFERIRTSLRVGGVFYASFKVGEGDFVDDTGRFFCLVTADEMRSILTKVPGFEVRALKECISLTAKDVNWLTIIVKKSFEPRPWYQTPGTVDPGLEEALALLWSATRFQLLLRSAQNPLMMPCFAIYCGKSWRKKCLSIWRRRPSKNWLMSLKSFRP